MKRKLILKEQDLASILANAIFGGGYGDLKQRIMNPKNEISDQILASIKNAIFSKSREMKTNDNIEFPELNLNTYNGFKAYEQICLLAEKKDQNSLRV